MHKRKKYDHIQSDTTEIKKLWHEFINKLPKNNYRYNFSRCPTAINDFCATDLNTFNMQLKEIENCLYLIEDYGVFLSKILGIANDRNGLKKLESIRNIIELLKTADKNIDLSPIL